MDKRVILRHNIEKVLDAYGYIFGGVTLELLMYHVNNHDKFKYTGWTEQEVKQELEYLLNIEKIEEIPSYTMKEKIKIKGDKKQWK